MPQPTKTLIAFATAWGTRFGGINCFNTDLLEAIAAAFFRDVRTVCVVLSATQEEIEAAHRAQVTLVGLGITDGKFLGGQAELIAWARLQEALGSWDLENTVWLGHDRISGAMALAACSQRGGQSALIHHMSYERYEAFAESSEAARVKEAEQSALFSKATRVMAVGPLLQDALSDMLGRPSVPCLIPGLPEIEQRGAPHKFQVFLSGRLHQDTNRLKQAQLGLAGFGHAVHLCDDCGAYPDALKGAREPGMRLRGVDFESMDGQTPAEAETEVKKFVEKHAGRALDLKLLPFTQDRRELFRELSGASVALMPSWHEGFGLVAWEAIAAGVPLILSKKSGVHRVLSEFKGGIYANCVQALDIKGTTSEPFFSDADLDALAEALIAVAKDVESWRGKAQQLRETLLSTYTWPACAQQFADAVGWPIQAPCPEPVPTEVVVSGTGGKDSLAAMPAAIARFLDRPQPCWQADQGGSMSRLLRAEEGIVPFDAQREPFLERQLAWAEATPYPIALRLLTGPGGTGKTRLALEMCARLANKGWLTGFLHSGNGTDMAELARQVGKLSQAGQRTCLVLDYAETRQSDLLTLLVELQQQRLPSSVCILLLARDGGEWWDHLHAQDPTCESLLEGEATSGPYILPPLHDSEASRQAAYQVALRSFAQRLDMAPPSGQPELDGDHFARPIHVQMAALMALHGEKPHSAQGLTRALLSHESRYWHKIVGESRPGLPLPEAALLMTLATLANGFTTAKEVEKVWEAAGGTKDCLRPLWRALVPLYPSRQGLQGLHPDLLGETLVSQSLLGVMGRETLAAMLGSSESKWRRPCLTVVSRILRQRDDLAPVVLETLSQHFVACAHDLWHVCLATPSPLPELAVMAFKRLPQAQQYQAVGLLKSLLQHEALPLTSLAVAVLEVECEKHCPKPGKGPLSIEKQQAWGQALVALSNACFRDGANARALAKAGQALTVYAHLLKLDRRRFEPAYAGILNNYANLLSNHGRAAEALECSKQSLDINQRLTQLKPEWSEPDYATSLNNHANHLAENGRKPEALECAKQALDIRQRLAHLKPEQFEPDYATSLSNYANHLAENGREAEALECARQALDIRQRLAQHKPERFEPDFATSLSNYASHMSDNGREIEALECARQALDLRQRLAQLKPDRFEPDFATSMNNYANRLSGNGRESEALDFAKQALDIYQRLAQLQPERFEPDHAISLNNYAFHLAVMGRYGDASSHQAQCDDMYTKQASRIPLQYAGDAYIAQNALALWRWLEDGQVPQEVLVREVPGGNARKQRMGQFTREFLQSMKIASTQKGSDKLKASLEGALAHWNRLDASQRQSHEPLFLLLAALQHHNLGADATPPGWQDQLARFKGLRQGRLPRWMVDAAARCGFQLGRGDGSPVG